MSGRSVPSQRDQVLPRFSVQKPGPYHAFGRIRIAPFGKGVLRILGESTYNIRNCLIYFALQRTGAGRTAARLSRNASPAAKNTCGAERAPHAAYIAWLPITLFAFPHPRRSSCASRASGTARARGISQEQRSDRSAHKRDYRQQRTPP